MPSETALEPGSLLAGRYRVDRAIASGGFGVVHAGHHLVLDTKVAIKVLRADRLDDGDRARGVAMFLAEARTLAKLRHPNVVSVLDAGIVAEKSLPWIVLEWCEGRTLKELLASGELSFPMRPRAVWRLLRPVALGVAHAHANGIAHRDLKPSNVILAREGAEIVPRVVDFGVAKESDGAAPSGDHAATRGGPMFTPAYAAPEQVVRARTGPWTDVHALGLLFVELLGGEAPYPAETPLDAAVDARRPTPRARGLVVSDAVEEALARALARRPAERTADAAAFIEEMDRAIDAEPEDEVDAPMRSRPPPAASVVARSTPPASTTTTTPSLALRTGGATETDTEATRPRPSSRARARLVAAGAALLVLVAVGIALWTGPWRRPAPDAAAASAPAPAPPTLLHAGGLEWRVQDGTWRKDGDALVGSGGQVMTTTSGAETTIDLDMDVVSEHGSHGVGVGFRAQPTLEREDGSGYGANVHPDSGLFIVVVGRDGTWWSIDANGYRPSPAVKPRHDHVAIHAAGEHLHVEVNGAPLADVDDATYAQGHVTLWVESAREIVRFSNIRITLR